MIADNDPAVTPSRSNAAPLTCVGTSGTGRLSVLVLIAALSACSPNQASLDVEAADVRHYKALLEADEIAAKNCAAKGGLPVRSEWNGRLKECKPL